MLVYLGCRVGHFGLRFEAANLDRHSYSKCRLSRLTLDSEIASMSLQTAMSDTEAEARARDLVLHRRASIEAFKDPRLLLRGYTVAVVGNSNSHSTIAAKRVNSDGHS